MAVQLNLEAEFANFPSEQKLKQGVTAAERQDHPTTFNIFSELAYQEYAQAQFNLGNMYSNGRGVAQDDRQAVAWFQKAAERDMQRRKTIWA